MRKIRNQFFHILINKRFLSISVLEEMCNFLAKINMRMQFKAFTKLKFENQTK